MNFDEPAFFTLRIPLGRHLSWISMNDRNREHWVKTKKVAAWRAATLHQLKRQFPSGLPKPLPPCTIRSTLIMASGRADPHNYTPTLKPIVDVLAAITKLPVLERVAAREFAGCWPDDGPNWIHIDTPYVQPRANKDAPLGVIVRAVPKER